MEGFDGGYEDSWRAIKPRRRKSFKKLIEIRKLKKYLQMYGPI